MSAPNAPSSQITPAIIAASFLLILQTLWFIARVSRPKPGGSGGAGFTRAIGTAFSDRAFVLLFVAKRR